MQNVDADAPFAAEKFPAAHVWQVVDEFAAITSEYHPGRQVVHVTDAVAPTDAE